ncbi:MAG: Gfo/Idh/MocA family protein [Dehalococcoidia bacterium]
MYEPLRVASVGLGRWANVLAQAAQRSEKLRIVSCFSRDPANRAAFSQRFGCRQAESLEELLRDEEVEAVILTVPNHLHAEQVEVATAQGKHIFLEKPIANTLEEARHIEQAVREAGITFMVDHSARRHQASRKLKTLLEEGVLGKVNMAEANFSTERGLELTPDRWRYHRELNPTGPLIQLSVHHIDTFRSLFGPIATVTAFLKRLYTPAEVEDTSLTILEHEKGVTTYVGSSWASPWAFYMAVYGTEANAFFRLSPKQWSNPPEAARPAFLELYRLGDGEMPEEVSLPPGEMFRDMLEDFADCVRLHRQPEVGPTEATAALAVVHAAIRSVEERRTVALQEILQG